MVGLTSGIEAFHYPTKDSSIHSNITSRIEQLNHKKQVTKSSYKQHQDGRRDIRDA